LIEALVFVLAINAIAVSTVAIVGHLGNIALAQ
jgi:hypothetical protein